MAVFFLNHIRYFVFHSQYLLLSFHWEGSYSTSLYKRTPECQPVCGGGNTIGICKLKAHPQIISENSLTLTVFSCHIALPALVVP